MDISNNNVKGIAQLNALVQKNNSTKRGKAMDSGTKLSIMTCYYLHNFLRKHKNEVKSIVAPGAGVCADSQADLDLVLESLYLEEDEIAVKVKQLETLTRYHQMLLEQNASPTKELIDVERQILWILGLKRVSS
ncbi:MAG: hypothetical protein KME08_18580 [Aphanothece sp. CMT-3BRIN-NPC111]|nr:hypothetical protein [Aphanothece sp. CMT-3BRIN-NPC111]